jgi:hypothetical protein
MTLSVAKVPYTGPYASTATKHPNKGPTVEALKRAVSRLGFITWKGTEFTQFWPHDGEFDRGFRKWQRSLEMPGDGVYGEQEWKAIRAAKVPKGSPNAGEYALDDYAQKLIQKEWKDEHVPDQEDFRKALTEFCLLAEANEDAWHYRQARPVDVTVDPGASYIWSDCSGFVIQAYHWAMQKSGLVVPDPSKQGWSGYGNTEWYEDDHPSVLSGYYRVGDLAHYSGHVTICRKAGTTTSGIFSSHGQEAGPIPTNVYYRRDFRKVVRPPLG